MFLKPLSVGVQKTLILKQGETQFQDIPCYLTTKKDHSKRIVMTENCNRYDSINHKR